MRSLCLEKNFNTSSKIGLFFLSQIVQNIFALSPSTKIIITKFTMTTTCYAILTVNKWGLVIVSSQLK